MLAPVLSAIESFDSAGAGDELSRLAAVLAPRDLVYQVAVPLMREVGIRWHNGTLAIAQEHLVSQMLRNLLGSMMRLFRPPNPAMKMVLCNARRGIARVRHPRCCHAGFHGRQWSRSTLARTFRPAKLRTPRSGRAKVVCSGITVPSRNYAEEVRTVAAAMPEAAELWVGGASSADLDLSNLGRRLSWMKDLPALENECRRWRN